LLLTIPNQLGVAYNAHVMEAILTSIAPALGWHSILAAFTELLLRKKLTGNPPFWGDSGGN
jgi:hypothetical protein